MQDSKPTCQYLRGPNPQQRKYFACVHVNVYVCVYVWDIDLKCWNRLCWALVRQYSVIWSPSTFFWGGAVVSTIWLPARHANFL